MYRAVPGSTCSDAEATFLYEYLIPFTHLQDAPGMFNYVTQTTALGAYFGPNQGTNPGTPWWLVIRYGLGLKQSVCEKLQSGYCVSEMLQGWLSCALPAFWALKLHTVSACHDSSTNEALEDTVHDHKNSSLLVHC